jgi:GntR family transcriptional regulator/MocR family aminotransferase
MYEMILELKEGSGQHLYEQIYRYMKSEIQRGNIRWGEKLPSTRLLAGQLDVSRSTVQMAYDQLLSEGYMESVPCRGYFVCHTEELYHLDAEAAEEEVNEEPEKSCCRYDLAPSGTDLEHAPYAVWRKLSREVFCQDQRELFRLGDPKGEYGLRSVICSYLHQARGVNVQPSQVVIGAGSDYLQMLLSRMLGTDRRIAMESPTYRHAYEIFQRLGYDCCTVSMDRYGMDVEELGASGADIAYVMPSHQYPLGTVMPVRRRQELLQWAAEREGRYIIEDDYDSDFRYVGRPIPSLQGSDRHQKVIYIGTFSRSIAPSIRIGYLVLPAPLLDRYEQVGRKFSCTVSRTDQRILQLFMERGYFERHLNKMRALYKSRHDVLLGEVRKIKGVNRILGERSGVHILLEMAEPWTEQELVRLAAEAGVRVYPLSEYCIDDQVYEPAVLLGYAAVTEDEIRQSVRILSKVWNRKKEDAV